MIKNYVIVSFLFCLILYLRVISSLYAPGGLYSEGRFNGGFFAFLVFEELTLSQKIEQGDPKFLLLEGN